MALAFFIRKTIDYSICQYNIPFTPKGVALYFSKGHIKPILVLCPPDG